MKKHLDRVSYALIVFAVALFLPAELWINVHSVTISDAAIGEDPTVLVTRDIYQSFRGDYTADIKSIETDYPVCGKPSGHNYTAGKRGSFTTKLVEYAGNDARCSTLPPGQYIGKFCWTVLDPFRFRGLGKKTCTSSNIFRIGDEK